MLDDGVDEFADVCWKARVGWRSRRNICRGRTARVDHYFDMRMQSRRDKVFQVGGHERGTILLERGRKAFKRRGVRPGVAADVSRHLAGIDSRLAGDMGGAKVALAKNGIEGCAEVAHRWSDVNPNWAEETRAKTHKEPFFWLKI